MNQFVKIKFNPISAILLILFCVPGIFGEGLHWIFPHSIPALSYENNFNELEKDFSRSHKNLTESKDYKFDPNCSICNFCNPISVILLILFCVPGIFGEGLHWIFPHSVPALSYENDFSRSQKSLPGSKYYKFDPNCPICNFCAQSKLQASGIVIFETGEWIRPFDFFSIAFHDSLSLLIRSGRGPPLSVC